MKMLCTDLEFKNAKVRDEISLECEYCHSEFKRTKRSILSHPKTNCCSGKCRSLINGSLRIVECETCKKSFEKTSSQIVKTEHNFCSKSCAAKTNNLGKQKNKPVDRICVSCNKIFQTTKASSIKSIYRCDSCVFIASPAKDMTVKEYQEKQSVKGKHSSWRNSHIRILNRSWNKELLLLPCQYCGYKNHIELAHIKSITSYDLDTKLSIVNSPDNLLVLCPNHHWEFDNNLLTIDQIPKRNKDSEIVKE